MSSAIAYTLLVLAVAVERVAELVVARRNEAWLRGRGAVQAGAGHYPVMVALHSGFLVACLAEVWLLGRPFVPVVGLPALALVTATMALRWWVIATLGRRWTTRVWVLPGEPRVTGGPFRWLPHPNYLAVAVELVALPLVHGAWWTALAFGGANLVLLRHRIRVEDGALAAAERAAGADTGRGAGGGAGRGHGGAAGHGGRAAGLQ